MTLPSLRTILIVAVVALLIIAILAIRGCSSGKTEAKLANGQGQAGVQSGRDAAQTVGNRAAADADTDATTKENDDEIRNTSGASAPVAGDTRDAILASLCRRAAYRSDPRCVQHPNP